MARPSLSLEALPLDLLLRGVDGLLGVGVDKVATGLAVLESSGLGRADTNTAGVGTAC